MTDLLFATPWWLPTAIIVAGIVVFISGNKRQKIGMRNTGAGLLLLAVALMAVSYLVETDREKVTRQTRELVKAVETRDWPKMQSMLDARVSLATVMGPIYANRDLVVQGAKDSVEHYGLKSVMVKSVEAGEGSTDITVSMDVFSVQDATMGQLVPSSWQLDWSQNGKDWVLFRITCLKIGNQSVSQFRSLFPK
jgi:hypothetical protein